MVLIILSPHIKQRLENIVFEMLILCSWINGFVNYNNDCTMWEGVKIAKHCVTGQPLKVIGKLHPRIKVPCMTIKILEPTLHLPG